MLLALRVHQKLTFSLGDPPILSNFVPTAPRCISAKGRCRRSTEFAQFVKAPNIFRATKSHQPPLALRVHQKLMFLLGNCPILSKVKPGVPQSISAKGRCKRLTEFSQFVKASCLFGTTKPSTASRPQSPPRIDFLVVGQLSNPLRLQNSFL
jgi:hypothetical protein